MLDQYPEVVGRERRPDRAAEKEQQRGEPRGEPLHVRERVDVRLSHVDRVGVLPRKVLCPRPGGLHFYVCHDGEYTYKSDAVELSFSTATVHPQAYDQILDDLDVQNSADPQAADQLFTEDPDPST